MFDGFKKGSGGRYTWDSEQRKWLKTSCKVSTNDAGFNGPVWFPKGGTKYFDKALQRTFYSKQEKKDYMRQHGLVMEGGKGKKQSGPLAGIGKTKYFFT